jgi:uncharacterized membrane protein
MPGETDVPVGLYIAAYSDSSAARENWEGIRALAKEKVIRVEALLLVSRAADGRIREEDNGHTIGIGGVLGAAGAFLIGLIFPPALVASTIVGPGAAGLVSHRDEKELKAEVANDLPLGSSGIVVLLADPSSAGAEQAMSKADNLSKHEVDRSSVEHARQLAPAAAPAGVA